LNPAKVNKEKKGMPKQPRTTLCNGFPGRCGAGRRGPIAARVDRHRRALQEGRAEV